MEKLIELLENWDGRNVIYNKQSDGGYMFWLGDLAFREERICSKKFGFIKWLVENDKIDKRQVHILCGTDDMEYNYSGEELILMELVIQDEPIRFLCEIIK